MEHNQKLKQQIMRRVYVIYIARKLLSGTALRLYALVLLAGGIISTVSVRDVFANMPEEGVGALYDFTVYALTHTELVVQLMLLSVTVVIAWLFRDAFQSFGHGGEAHSIA